MSKPRRPSLNARRLYGLIKLKNELEDEQMRDMWQMSPDEQRKHLADNWDKMVSDDKTYHYDGKVSKLDTKYVPYFFWKDGRVGMDHS